MGKKIAVIVLAVILVVTVLIAIGTLAFTFVQETAPNPIPEISSH